MVIGRRASLLATAALLASAAVAPVPSASAAAPDPAVCASPTSTLSGGGSQTIAVPAGQVVLLTAGTYTGALDPLSDGGTLCVAAGAVFNAKSMRADPAGDLVVLGTADLPTFTSAKGFDLLVAGTLTVSNVTLSGGGSVTVTATGSVSTGTFLANAGSLIDNRGTLDTRLTTNSDSAVVNSGSFTTHSGLAIDGSLRNTGHVVVIGGALRFNPGSTLSNECVIDATDDVTVNSSSGVTNAGIIRADPVSGVLRVGETGVYTQTPVGILTSDSLDNRGTVNGFGRYRFGRTTHTENVFVGSSAASPIVVQDLTPPAAPKIFDQQTGTVANTVAGIVPAPPADATVGTCAGNPVPAADVTLAKTGPATVAAGGQVSYTITAHNAGPDTATGLTVTDTLPAQLTSVTASAGGTVAAGTVTWTQASLANGADAIFTITGTAPASGTFTDRASSTATTADANPANNNGSSPAHSVTTEVVATPPPVNNPPTVGDAAVAGRAGKPVAGSVPLADEDAGQQVTASPGSPPRSGTVTLSADGVFEYTPLGTFTGVDTFTVIGCDNGEPRRCATGTVTVVVAPDAVDDSAETVRGVPVSIDVLLNDFGDVVGGPTLVDAPTNGAVSPNGEELVYTPAAGFTGTDTFTYRICSGGPLPACATALVSVLVKAPANQRPTAEDTAVSGPVDTVVEGRVPVNDPDVDQTLTVTLLGAPSAGTALVNADGTFTFTPPDDVADVFTFTVRACDNAATPLCDDATVTVTITPVAEADSAETTVDTPVTVDVVGNDRGGVGNPTAIGPGPSNGDAVIDPGGQVTYTPDPGFTGTDTFTYTVCATAEPLLCTPGQVTVTVGAAPNRPPTVADAQLETSATVPVEADLVFTDPDPGQALTFTVTTGPADGTATVDAEGRVRYEPTGEFTGRDQFTVQVCDDAATPACDTALVDVTVSPLAVDDSAVVDADTSVVIEVEANDVGDVGPIQNLSDPANGTAEAEGSVRYTPDSGFVGTDTFTYQICSSNPGDGDVCDTATVVVTVLPIATSDLASTHAGLPVAVAVLDNDTAGANPVVTVLSGPANGTVRVGAAGVLTYTPAGTFTGHDSVVYRVCAPAGPPLCAQTSATFDVLPRLVDDHATTLEEEAVSIDVPDNDFGDAGRAVVTAPPAHGTVTGGGVNLVRAVLGAPGDLGGVAPLVYTPLPGFVGTDTFTYVRCSPADTTLCSQAVVTVTVLPKEAPPPPPPTPTPTPTPTPPGPTPPGPTPPGPTPPGTTSPGGGTVLPSTGAPFGPGLVVLGLLLVVLGGATCLAARRRGLNQPG